MQIENENTFNKALREGINLFTGAGFSILAKNAEGQRLPLGNELRDELIGLFKIEEVENLNLAKICTIIQASKKDIFESYIRNRFKVNEFDNKYLNLLNIKIYNIFTTNIDDLIFKIYANTERCYINDLKLNGPAFRDMSAINYISLHGSIVHEESEFKFGAIDIASAFSYDRDSWHTLRNMMNHYPTLFCGYSMEDSGTLEAFKPAAREKKDIWAMVYPEKNNIGVIRYFRALGFQIVEAKIEELLDYFDKIKIPLAKDSSMSPHTSTIELFPQDAIPKLGQIPVRPIIEFYKGAPPSWYDIFSNQIHKSKHVASIKNSINSGRNTIVIGLPACGKTTLMMQVAAEMPFQGHKLVIDAITPARANNIIVRLNGEKALIFIDNIADDIESYSTLSEADNIQVIGFDRDYNFEMVSHKVNRECVNIIDVTELELPDIQNIISRIPANILVGRNIEASSFIEDEKVNTIFDIIETTISLPKLKERFKSVINDLEKHDYRLTDFLLLCCYVHSCHTFISFDMLLAYFRDLIRNYREIYDLQETLASMITDNVGELTDSEQDYFVPRSILISEAVIDQAPSDFLRRMLRRFHYEISPLRIYRYDVFKRHGYDAGLIYKAFDNPNSGKEFYEYVCQRDSTPYIKQQCALYLLKNKKYNEAFQWIDDAINQSAGKIISIRNSHAIILFEANIDIPETDGTVKNTLRHSMTILEECYYNDKRKTYHAVTFAGQALKYWQRYKDNEAIDFLKKAEEWLLEEQKKYPWHRWLGINMRKIKEVLTKLQKI